MNNADLKALTDKRAANIQKLNNYLNAGKTAEEKIVEKLITQIKNAEDKLSSAGIKLTEKINNDGTFTMILDNEDSTNIEDVTVISTEEQSENNIDVEESTDNPKSDEVAKKKSSKKVTPTKKLRDNNTSSKPEVVKIGVTVKENIKLKLDALAEDSNIKPNEAVVDLLGKLFDGKNFNIEFEKKEKTKVTSYNIPAAMDKALIKLNKTTGIPKTELFNKLLEEALKEFF
ncbi:hypothetical protein [Clostridium perfringens]|uniref:hypothetical protein n=1 Tax=Clostridium perfringens TaxID=1502 RepID=UPI002AC49D6B|nr:hypothetical protein [Clostridium perfringens]MDZ5019664.1 hypothetical protein [Clostridium perfringens]